MLRRNGPVVKSVESVLRLEGSLWGERFVEEVGNDIITTNTTAPQTCSYTPRGMYGTFLSHNGWWTTFFAPICTVDYFNSLQCFDTVGWASGIANGLQKIE